MKNSTSHNLLSADVGFLVKNVITKFLLKLNYIVR